MAHDLIKQLSGLFAAVPRSAGAGNIVYALRLMQEPDGSVDLNAPPLRTAAIGIDRFVTLNQARLDGFG